MPELATPAASPDAPAAHWSKLATFNLHNHSAIVRVGLVKL